MIPIYSTYEEYVQMNAFQRAMQIWSILVLAAKNRQVLTYGLVGRAIGIPPVALRTFLSPIQDYCLRRGFPPLTVLVVNKDTGVPGEGFIAATDIPRAQAEVFQFDWLNHQAPDEDELRVAIPGNAAQPANETSRN